MCVTLCHTHIVTRFVYASLSVLNPKSVYARLRVSEGRCEARRGEARRQSVGRARLVTTAAAAAMRASVASLSMRTIGWGRTATTTMMTTTRKMTKTKEKAMKTATVVRAMRGEDARGNGAVSDGDDASDSSDDYSSSSRRESYRDDERVGDGRAGATTTFVAETTLPTDRGFYRVRAYRHLNPNTGEVSEPVCVIHGEVEGREDVPVRVHDACFTSEVLGSMKCDCKQQLEMAMDYIKENGPGIVCYLQQEGRGIGLANKIAAYAVQEEGVDTVDANRRLGLPDDTREYTAVKNMLRGLDVRSVQLMTNNPRKIRELERGGVKITGRIACVVNANLFNKGYLAAKERRMSHVLDQSWRYWEAAGAADDSVGELDA